METEQEKTQALAERKQLRELSEAYMSAHAGAEDPRNMRGMFTDAELIKVLQDAGGREIVWRAVPGVPDLMTYYFK